MLECVIGIVCNEWRIFHCETGVCPDFCDVIVKVFAYYTTSFIKETAFSFRVLYTNVPSRVLRLLVLEVMLQERIWAEGLRGWLCLSVGEPGRGLVYRGLVCRRRVWRWAPLCIGAPLRRRGWGGSVHPELRAIVEGGLCKRSIPLYGRSVR
jgi:hypothetical protein